MDVVMIGAGNIAHVLGRELVRSGHRIQTIWNRNSNKAKILAEELGASYATSLDQIPKDADLYVLAVTDTAISELVSAIKIERGILVHTAGSVSIKFLSAAASRYGVIWPMKMIRSNMKQLGSCTIIVDGESADTMEQLQQIVRPFAERVATANDQMRMKMHLIAAITSNFSNHIYHLAADYCDKEDIDFSLFYPIIETTAVQIQTNNPADVQAGPAFRGDKITIEKHRSLLTDTPFLLRIYDEISKSILEKFGRDGLF